MYRLDNKQKVAGATEEELYSALEVAWIPPELRENQGEIEAASEDKLPELVKQSSIRGDLHMHTLEQRTGAPPWRRWRRRLWRWVTITSPSPIIQKALAMANGLDERRAVALAKRVREINRNGLGIRVLSGLECDIMRDGSMDLADDALAELDLVIGSVQQFHEYGIRRNDRQASASAGMPYLNIMGHPTGRILLRPRSFFIRFRTRGRAAARG